MQKPNNYDNTQSFGGFTPIELGGHVCIIKKVEEITSKTGKEMIKIEVLEQLNIFETDKISN